MTDKKKTKQKNSSCNKKGIWLFSTCIPTIIYEIYRFLSLHLDPLVTSDGHQHWPLLNVQKYFKMIDVDWCCETPDCGWYYQNIYREEKTEEEDIIHTQLSHSHACTYRHKIHKHIQNTSPTLILLVSSVLGICRVQVSRREWKRKNAWHTKTAMFIVNGVFQTFLSF